MEIITNNMSEIARKTKTETVSMKIITLVTLFFLPGTFIAVSFSFLYTLVSQIIAFGGFEPLIGVVPQLSIRSARSKVDG